ncbi:hypothetical protein CEXT_604861 [Caerostris extrusa]|uniref:Uncharacterized protein n=1 Tax=Caerostris extrusa TaxID=172846 RepID=A0AAV4S656_CAEEX|nr:hypothetical protein CEXT_604861 [Caerostris extrusa]
MFRYSDNEITVTISATEPPNDSTLRSEVQTGRVAFTPIESGCGPLLRSEQKHNGEGVGGVGGRGRTPL